MIVRRSVLLLIAAVLAAMSGFGSAETPKPADKDKPADAAKPGEPAKVEMRKNAHALLVGVTFYENLSKSKHLEGPANDVVMMAKVLTEKFHFDPKNITTLSEEEGKAKGEKYLPKKANIEREFKRLGEIAKEGDYIVICMGGHGSQQPEDRVAKAKIFKPKGLEMSEPEQDGMDSIFLPRDVGKWDGGSGTVQNAIIDDEIANWIKPFEKNKASLWIVFDSCHSGGMTRGADEEKKRDADPTTDLGIPKNVIEDTVAAAEAREKKKGERARGGPPRTPCQLAKHGGVVAIYAAQNIEVTLEREMPARSRDAKVYGLLSYTIASVLTEAAENSKEPITYNELAKRIQAHYTAWGRTFPTPLIEGTDRDREVLGDKVWPGRSSMLISIRDDVMKVNAGSIHGITVDSILSVKPPAGKADKLLGYVKVKEVRPFDCDVEACDEQGKEAKTEFDPACRCEKYIIAPGDQKLRVGVDPEDEPKKGKLSAELVKQINKSLEEVAKDSKVIVPVEKLKDADWIVRKWSKADDKVILVPGAGWSNDKRDNADSEAFGPTEVNDKLDGWLQATLEAINRAETVKKMAAAGGAEGSDSGVKVKVEPIRYKGRAKADRTDPIPVPFEGAEVPVYKGDLLALKVSNPGKVAVDVTVLFVSAKYGIECMFPDKGQINRLQPGDSITIPDPAGMKPYFGVNTKTIGKEQLVVLAVKASAQPVDFHILEQPDLEASASRAVSKPPDENALKSPVGNLLRSGIFGDTKSRGLSKEETDDYATQLIPLRVNKDTRPKPDDKPKSDAK